MKPITWKPILKFTLKSIESALARIWKTILKLASADTWKPLLKFILKYLKLLAVLAAIIIGLAVTALVFYRRPPVLVVTDAPFIELYGKERIRRRQILSSLALFRRVKPVITADGASPDIIVEAISGAAQHPYCVLFPAYLAPAAESFHLQFPETQAAVLVGFSPFSGLPQSDGVLCVYRTDLETDMYRAGLFAGLLGLKNSSPDVPRICFLWQDHYIQAAERESFSRGLKESDPDAVARFAKSDSDMPDPEGISCVVLGRSGAEYLEKNARTPLILFSWLDPSMLPAETAAAFDDSTWALAVPAVRMAVSSQAEGKIPSKPLIFSGETADNGIDRLLKQLAKKKP
jgi:hypothetical protein